MNLKNTKLTIIISIIITIFLAATYAYLELSAPQSQTTGEGGCFNVNYSGQEINNLSLRSTTNYQEGASSDIELSKAENCEIYTEASIYLNTNIEQTNAPLENGALKYKVMQGATEIISGTIAAATAETNDQLLATVPLTTTPTTYTVYLWIDPSISHGSYHDKTYAGHFYASSIQSSTITG